MFEKATRAARPSPILRTRKDPGGESPKVPPLAQYDRNPRYRRGRTSQTHLRAVVLIPKQVSANSIKSHGPRHLQAMAPVFAGDTRCVNFAAPYDKGLPIKKKRITTDLKFMDIGRVSSRRKKRTPRMTAICDDFQRETSTSKTYMRLPQEGGRSSRQQTKYPSEEEHS